MELNVKKPVVFLDLETTGISVTKDRIVEIALLKINTDGTQEEYLQRVNPEGHIPEDASAIHHIYDADVENEPTFKEIARNVAKFIKGCDLAGYNSNRFDIPMLAEEILRAENALQKEVGIDLKKANFIDVQTIFHKMEKRTLVAAYKLYCDKNLEGAHSAMADTKATYEVLKAQLDRYEGVEYEDFGKISKPIVNDMQQLSEFSSFDKNVDFAGRIVYDKNGVEVFNFGKNKGVPVEKVLRDQPGYYGWMIDGDFPRYTKKVLTDIRLRMMQNR